MKKVFITGHTKGIGRFLFNYFQNKGYQVQGVCRHSSHLGSEGGIDISDWESMKNAVLEFDPDMFVNNAHSGFSQVHLLNSLAKVWSDNKIILNISSNVSDFSKAELKTFSYELYDTEKSALDYHAEKNQFANSNLKIINLRPGLVDTDRVRDFTGHKLNENQFVDVVDSILNLLEKGIYVQEITFSHIDQFQKK